MFVQVIQFVYRFLFMLRDNQRRARTARLVFLLLMLVSGLLVVLSMVGQTLPDWEAASADSSSSTTSLLYLLYCLLIVSFFLLLILSYVVLIMWLRRAYYNLHQLPTIHPEFSDGWAAGAWFVPFLNLVRPYTIMREVWNDTQRAAWGRIAEPATVLGWWWGACIIELIVGRITSRMTSGSETFTKNDLIAFMLDGGMQFITAGLAWHIIGRIATFEEELALRQQVDRLGQPMPSPDASRSAEQSDYALEEDY